MIGIIKHMKTKIILAKRNFSKKDLSYSLEVLKRGDLVAFPTETVYGLGGVYDDLSAIRKIYHVKNRPLDNPLILHIGEISWVELVSEEIPKEFFILANKFFPGPLTIVLPKKKNVDIFPHLSTIAIRMPSHKIALSLLKALKKPLFAPSANLSGKPSPTDARHVLQDLMGKIPLIIDGGKSDVGIESSVIMLSKEKPVLLRPGSISKKELEGVLKKEVFTNYSFENVLSPGMKYRHYAPNGKIHFLLNQNELFSYSDDPKARVLLYRRSTENIPLKKNIYLFDEKNLYFLFRKFDEEKVLDIYIFIEKNLQENEGLLDRIMKAKS